MKYFFNLGLLIAVLVLSVCQVSTKPMSVKSIRQGDIWIINFGGRQGKIVFGSSSVKKENNMVGVKYSFDYGKKPHR